MSHVLRVGVADQIAYFRAYNTDGSANTSLTASTTGLTLSVFRVGASSVSIASLSNKAADNTAHADGAIRNVGGNLYTIDLPDAACATQVPSICVRGSYTGGVIEGLEHPITAYDPAVNYASSLQATAIETDTVDIQARIPAALVGGRIDASVGNYQAGMAPPTTAQIEAALVNEGDATALLQAIADKISGDLTAGDLTALAIVQAIKNDATLAQMISRIDAQITSRPTLAAIEGSSILAKESTVTARPTLAQIEASTVLAKEATVTPIATNVTTLVNRITTGVASMFGDLITMITGGGTANAKFTAKAVEEAGGADVYFYPVELDQSKRHINSEIEVFTDETGSQFFFAKDATGAALDLTGRTLEFRIADSVSKTRLYTAKTSDGTLTISLGNKVTFTRAISYTKNSNASLQYSLRDVNAGNETLLKGNLKVTWAP